MKNEFKKLFALMLALVLAASTLTACGGDSAETTAAQEETEAQGEETPAAEGGEFVIGAIGPITGAAAVYGNAVMNGAQIAVDEINAAGGVNGMTLVLNPQDDEHDPEKSVNAYNTLKDAGAKAILGSVTSDPCIAVLERTAADHMFQITPSGSALACINTDNAFRVCFADPNQGIASAQYMKELGYTKIGVIYDSSTSYSSGIYEKFVQEAATQGLEVVAAESFVSTGGGTQDFTVQLQKVAEAQPEVLFLPIYYQEGALILKQASAAGYNFQFFGVDGFDGIIDQLGEDAALAEGTILLTPFAADEDSEIVQNFVAKYQENYGEIPNQFAADAYDGIYIIKAAMEKAGITADMDYQAVCDALSAAMLEIEVVGTTGSMTWGEDHECAKSPKGVRIENGVYVAIQ